MGDRDLDAEFERIIAGWADEAPDPQRIEPAPGVDEPDVPGPQGGEPQGGEPRDGVSEGHARPSGVLETPAPRVPQPDGAADVTPPTAPPTTPPTTQTGPSPTGAAEPPANPSSPGAPGQLELPIAPTTSHAWRSGSPRRDDADDVLEALDPDDDHFVPPSEIDLPSAETDPMFWAIVGGLAGGPLLLLYVLFFDRDGSGWWVVTALAMVVVGFVLLVLRGGTERDPFDDGTRV